MTILAEDGSVPRRRSPPAHLSSFPPRAPLASLNGNYHSVPTADYSPYAPYDDEPPRRSTRSRDWDDQGDFGESLSPPRTAWHRLARHSKARNKTIKTAALGLAGVALLYLLLDAWSRPRGHHGGPHRHGPPPLDDDGVPWPPPPPPPPDRTAPSPGDPPDAADAPIVDLAQFIQPRRPVPPSWPDPWADESRSWQGRKWLSPVRFGSSSTGWKDLAPPPRQDPPPARYLLRALEFTAATAGRAVDGSRAKLQPGVAFDERTGRPKRVPHEVLKLGRDRGWKPPRGFRASELGSGTVGEKDLPRVQFDGDGEEEEDSSDHRVTEEQHRRDWVKRAFMHAWTGLTKHAWGHDEVQPVSNLWSDNYNGWGASIVDSLDTLLVMNLSREYTRARQHVAAVDFTFLVPSGSKTFSTKLPPLEDLEMHPPSAERPQRPTKPWVDPREAKARDQHSPATIPWFEITIRYLGGLLSAYDLSSDPLMLDRATELGDWLLPALATDHGLPLARYALGSNPDGGPAGRVTLAEVGSLSLEFTRLSQLTGNEIYFEAAQRAMDTLDKHFAPAVAPPSDPKELASPNWGGRLGALLPAHLDVASPKMLQGEYTFGGLADSYYEYLIKQAQLTSFALEQYPRMYRDAVDSAYEHLIRPVDVVPGREDLTLVGSVNLGKWQPSLQHLTCFAGGMLGLGARLLNRPHDLDTAINVTNACAWTYESSKTGIGGENTVFYEAESPSRYMVLDRPDSKGKYRAPRGSPTGVRMSDRRQIGRPETIESVFYMYRLTGDRRWQDVGWTMFVNWVRHSITEGGFATIRDVNKVPVQRDDSQESFVLAESLKYYYLLFSPRDLLSLDDWVFTTEAHPFFIRKPSGPARPEPLWTGPDTSSSSEEASLTSQIGEGTWVQKWARVQQAAAFAKEVWRPLTRDGNVPAARPGPAGGRNFVRPPDDEVRRAKEEAARRLAPLDKHVRPAGVYEGGGGRGMGGGGV
ncbi:glycoside hydrolase [Rhodotorula diobovata]|uniref:alpha-1,2-Mannosidase n=1 Tax=Rhodotorula diobovata TaxID=5288 RepID=A0A5C5FYU4_9BASI|nr:glycoside hydrolase [Rhodotorula diobovata]